MEWRSRTRLTAIALATLVSIGAAAEERESDQAPHVLLFGRPGIIVSEVVTAAIQRVARPECERLIGELNDETGRPLAWNLSERNMTPAHYLAEIRFMDGDGLSQCLTESTVAVTVPNSRVVWVCGRRFARYFSLRRPRGVAIIIHELLHSLGLPENPPSSAEITEMVEQRCVPQ